MCGIAGAVGPDVSRWIQRMVVKQVHRGPDDEGLFVDERAAVALGMRRLSILDLSGGHQPMPNETRSLWVVFNGEVFNSPELRSELEREGVRFTTTNSDTEVLLRLYETRGEDMLAMVNGMFAFVIYDVQRGRLFGARDRLGIKPLYYCCDGGRFGFASELKALLELPWAPRELNLESCYHYLSLLYVPGRASILKGINRLQPGESFRFDLRSGNLSFDRYWCLEEATRSRRDIPAGEWTALVRGGLREAVRRWTLADVPIGCSLSGGLDSSAVVGLMRETGVSRVRTYSVGFEEQNLNELPLARLVARKWDTEHHEFILSADGLLDALPAMVWHLDEPYGGGLPSWYVFQVMSADVRVAMTGTGGDELFGAYGKYRYLEAGVTSRLRSIATGAKLTAGRWTVGDLARFAGGSRRTCFHDAFYYFTDASKQTLFTALPESVCTAGMFERMLSAVAGAGPRNAATVVDMRTQLPEEFLAMTDRFSMAYSVEARVPFLDHEFVELCLSIPPSLRFRDDDYKYLLRRAIGDLLPPEVLQAPKQGFVLPIAGWLDGRLRGLVETLLSRDRLQRQGIFNPSLYDDLVLPFFSARDGRRRPVQIWALLMFQLWHWVFLEQRFDATPKVSAREIVA